MDGFIQKQFVFALAAFWSYATLLKGPCTTHQLSRYSWRSSKYLRANWEHFKVLYRSWLIKLVANITIIWHGKICSSRHYRVVHLLSVTLLMLKLLSHFCWWWCKLWKRHFSMLIFIFSYWRECFSWKNNLSSGLNFLFCERDMHYQIYSAGYLLVLPPHPSSYLLLFSTVSLCPTYISWSGGIYLQQQEKAVSPFDYTSW